MGNTQRDFGMGPRRNSPNHRTADQKVRQNPSRAPHSTSKQNSEGNRPPKNPRKTAIRLHRLTSRKAAPRPHGFDHRKSSSGKEITHPQHRSRHNIFSQLGRTPSPHAQPSNPCTGTNTTPSPSIPWTGRRIQVGRGRSLVPGFRPTRTVCVVL